MTPQEYKEKRRRIIEDYLDASFDWWRPGPFESMLEELEGLDLENDNLIATKDAEIARLTTLLERETALHKKAVEEMLGWHKIAVSPADSTTPIDDNPWVLDTGDAP